jgi:hypothetical protein
MAAKPKPKVNRAYSAFEKALHTKGIQPGERERIAAIAAHRGVTQAEARKIAKRRVRAGRNIAGSAEAGGELRRGSVIVQTRSGVTPTGPVEKTVTMRRKGVKADKGVLHRKQLRKEGEKIAARGQRRMDATRRKDEISPATKAKEAKAATDAQKAHDRSVAIALARRRAAAQTKQETSSRQGARDIAAADTARKAAQATSAATESRNRQGARDVAARAATTASRLTEARRQKGENDRRQGAKSIAEAAAARAAAARRDAQIRASRAALSNTSNSAVGQGAYSLGMPPMRHKTGNRDTSNSAVGQGATSSQRDANQARLDALARQITNLGRR